MSPAFVVTACSICHGSMLLTTPQTVDCAACEGTREIMGSPCAWCGGKGRQEIEVTVPCPNCMEEDLSTPVEVLHSPAM
jgi:hypothetical protein